MQFKFLSQTLFLTLFSSLLFAQTPKPKAKDERPTTEKHVYPAHTQKSLPSVVRNSHVEVGATYSYVWVHPHGFEETQGSLGGAQAIYEYRPADAFYGALAVSWKQGKTTGHHVSHTILNIDSQERLGYSYCTSDKMTRFSLFTGVGYRYLGEKRTRLGTEAEYNYNDFYIPVGFVSDSQVNSMLSLGLNFQWKPQVFTTVTTVPLNGASWHTKRQLVNFLIEAPISVLFQEEQLSLKFVPFFEIWNDGETTATTLTGITLSVPKLKYYFSGIKINLEYSF